MWNVMTVLLTQTLSRVSRKWSTVSDAIEDLKNAVLTWQISRVPLSEKFSSDGLRGFAEAMNFHTGKLIRLMGTSDPEFYSAMMEMAQHAQTMVGKGKFIVDRKDRTNL
jgi:hypothetical protein